MAMRFGDNSEEQIVAEINITPLTDVFLVLLIIFMISSSAMLEGGLNVKLPTAKSTALASSGGGKPVYVTIGKEGELLVNETSASHDTLSEQLKAALMQSDEKTVIVRGDETILLGMAVKIMDAARNAGASKIALATRAPEKAN